MSRITLRKAKAEDADLILNVVKDLGRCPKLNGFGQMDPIPADGKSLKKFTENWI